jgi:hypothetical protein
MIAGQGFAGCANRIEVIGLGAVVARWSGRPVDLDDPLTTLQQMGGKSGPEAMDTVTVDKTHRGHAIIEQVHADLKNSALAHLPSGVFAANAAWLVCAAMAFNLTRAAATTTGAEFSKATTATIRRKLITVPARLASSARRLTIHLPAGWPWQAAWTQLFTHACGPPTALAS